MYAWMPSNCERFYETYESIEEAVAEAQKQWDEKYEYYEEKVHPLPWYPSRQAETRSFRNSSRST